MLGFLLLRVPLAAGTSSGTSVCLLNAWRGDTWWKAILECQKGLNRVSATTISYFVGLILSRLIFHSSGEKSIIRLWLIFAGLAVVIDLPVTLLTIWLKALLGGIATLGRGSGVALRKAGRGLRSLSMMVATISKRA